MNKNSHHKGSLLKKGISFLLLLIMTVPVLAVNNATLFQQVKQKKLRSTRQMPLSKKSWKRSSARQTLTS